MKKLLSLLLLLTLSISTSKCMSTEGALDEIDKELISLAQNDSDRGHIVDASRIARIESSDKEGRTRLHWAIVLQNKPLVEKLIKIGADPNAAESTGLTPLVTAAGSLKDTVSKDIIDILLKAGASPDIATHNMRTPIHTLVLAYLEKPYDQSFTDVAIPVLDSLFTDAKNKNPQDKRGNTPLYILIAGLKDTLPQSPIYQLIEKILKQGASPNIQNKDGFTPLHAAVSKQNLELVKLLLNSGANPHIRSFIPRTMAEIQQGVAPKPDKTPYKMAQQLKLATPEKERLTILKIELALLEALQKTPSPVSAQQPVPAPHEPTPIKEELTQSDLEIALQNLATSLQDLRSTLL